MKTHRWKLWFALLAASSLCIDALAQVNVMAASERRSPAPEVLDEAGLMKTLFAELRQISPYRKQVAPLQVIRLPHAQLEAMVCKRPCNVLGFYREGEIYLDDRLHPESDLYDRSVLLHEMLHYLQDVNGAWGTDANCDRWYLREMEAYSTQRQFLSAGGSAVHLFFPSRSLCLDDATRQTSLTSR